MGFPSNFFFGNVFPYPDVFCPKTQMVRMVHMNVVYKMDLEIRDPKSEFCTNTENIDFRKVAKINNYREISFDKWRSANQ